MKKTVLFLAIISIFFAFGCSDKKTDSARKDASTNQRVVDMDNLSSFSDSEAVAASNPVVVVKTNKGSFDIELFEKEAPITVKNFLDYVDAKFYDGTIFHRVISNFMIQGGGFTKGMAEKSPRGPIKNEADNGLKNVRGTIAMARTNVVDSATAQFFINVVDSPFLDHGARDFGYAVFGRVTSGMDVVDTIRNSKTHTVGFHNDVPVQDIVIQSIRRVDK